MLKTYEADREKLKAASRKALDYGKKMLRQEGLDVNETNGMRQIVWRLIQDAARTLQILPDRERGWLLSAERACWPEFRQSFQERWEVEVSRMQDGMPPDDPPAHWSRSLDPGAVDRMLTVLSWFQFMRARDAYRHKRDTAVTIGLASGYSQAQVRRLLGGNKGHSAAHMVKQKAIGQIAQVLQKWCWEKENLDLTKPDPVCINSTQ